jgi:hypothetical protein
MKTISFSSQVEQLQLDSMIMTEDGSRENTSSSVPTEFVDMDSAEKVNEEKLDLTVSSSMNSKKICASWHSAVESDNYIGFKTKIKGGREGSLFLITCIQTNAVVSNNPMIDVNALKLGRWAGGRLCTSDVLCLTHKMKVFSCRLTSR